MVAGVIEPNFRKWLKNMLTVSFVHHLGDGVITGVINKIRENTKIQHFGKFGHHLGDETIT